MSTHETNESDEELLSALMDGELSAGEQARVLVRLQADPALRRRWARFHAVRAALTTGAAPMSLDFAERVGRARLREPIAPPPGRERAGLRSWLRPAAGLAIAASVALVAFGSLTLLRESGPDAPVTVAENDATQGLSGSDTSVSAGVSPVAINTDVELSEDEQARLYQQMLLYLGSHSVFSDAAGENDGIVRNPEWVVTRLPEGFRAVSHRRHGLTPAGRPVQHSVYSDGRASVSVFVEPLGDAAPFEGKSSMGAVQAYCVEIEGHLVTVVGEVSKEVVRAIAESVRRTESG